MKQTSHISYELKSYVSRHQYYADLKMPKNLGQQQAVTVTTSKFT